MEDFKLKNGDTIRIPTTGEDWELYTCEHSCKRAARALTMTLKVALALIDQSVTSGKTVAEAVALASQMVAKTQETYSEDGAADSEPNGVKAEAFSAFCASRYGRNKQDAEIWEAGRYN